VYELPGKEHSIHIPLLPRCLRYLNPFGSLGYYPVIRPLMNDDNFLIVY